MKDYEFFFFFKKDIVGFFSNNFLSILWSRKVFIFVHEQ